MCGHCGCSGDKARLSTPGSEIHRHLHHEGDSLQLQQALLAGNDELARQNRDWLIAHGITCINLMGTPGAGKTRLLEATFAHAPRQAGWPPMAVLEGDQHTQNDARRIQACGGRVVQINTGTGCHLDAHMIQAGLATLAAPDGALVLVENVGNLVCPALFDLVIINKADLLPYLKVDLDSIKSALRRLNPHVQILVLSAQSGEGLNAWYDWLLSTRP